MDDSDAVFEADLLVDEADPALTRVSVEVTLTNRSNRDVQSATALLTNRDSNGDHTSVQFGEIRAGRSLTRRGTLGGWPDAVFFTVWFSSTVSASGGGTRPNMRRLTLIVPEKFE